MAGRLVQAGAGPALVRFAHAGSAGGLLCVEGRLVQVWRRAGASHFGSRTISRRSHSVAGRSGQGRHWSSLLTQDQQAVSFVWRDGWSRAGAGRVGSRSTSRRSNSVAGRLVQAGAGPALVRFAHTGSAGGPRCMAGWPVQV